MTSEMISDYVIVGGAPAIKVVVDDFYERVLGDDQLAPYFKGVDLARLKGHQAAFISEVMGGPKQYAGRTIVEAHRGRGITEDAFSRVAVHLLAALNAAGVPEDIATRTGQKAMALRDAVVHGRESR